MPFDVFGETTIFPYLAEIKNIIRGCKHAPLYDGTAYSIKAYLGAGTTSKVKFSLFDVITLALSGVTQEITVDTSKWWEALFPDPRPPLISGKEYYIMGWAKSTCKIRQTGGEPLGHGAIQSKTYNSFPDPLVPTYDENKRSIQCVYEYIAPPSAVQNVVCDGLTWISRK